VRSFKVVHAVFAFRQHGALDVRHYRFYLERISRRRTAVASANSTCWYIHPNAITFRTVVPGRAKWLTDHMCSAHYTETPNFSIKQNRESLATLQITGVEYLPHLSRQEIRSEWLSDKVHCFAIGGVTSHRLLAVA
jgi:hypothetical protein